MWHQEINKFWISVCLHWILTSLTLDLSGTPRVWRVGFCEELGSLYRTSEDRPPDTSVLQCKCALIGFSEAFHEIHSYKTNCLTFSKRRNNLTINRYQRWIKYVYLCLNLFGEYSCSWKAPFALWPPKNPGGPPNSKPTHKIVWSKLD